MILLSITMITFVHDSDIHFTDKGPRSDKKLNPDKIIELNPDFTIVTGDLTDNGYDGKSIGCFKYGGFSDQLSPLKDNYVHKLEDNGIPVYLCPGNHDRGRPNICYKAVHRYIIKRHGGLKYSFERNGIKFICCGEYPDDLKWLKKQLKKANDRPIFIYFHFNLIGPFSNWWSEKEKDKFYQVIKDYPNLQAILVGHWHRSENHTKWNNIRVIRSSGRGFTLIGFDIKEEKIIDVKFIN